eukprot:2751257-Rhodomonas_salina.2
MDDLLYPSCAALGWRHHKHIVWTRPAKSQLLTLFQALQVEILQRRAPHSDSLQSPFFSVEILQCTSSSRFLPDFPKVQYKRHKLVRSRGTALGQ